MRALVLGGTRNLGAEIVAALLDAGHDVSVANRGLTRDTLPPKVRRIRADRSVERSLAAALEGMSFDATIDLTTYDARDAGDAVTALRGRTARYVFISSGQVYLIRDPEPRFPARESDAEGPLAPEPLRGDPSYEGWLYGIGKRDGEHIVRAELRATILRLPMVAGRNDHYHRIANYVARIRDGNPVLVPRTDNRPVRHVLGTDVARIIVTMLGDGRGVGGTFNLSSDETLELETVLATLADAVGVPLRIHHHERGALERARLLPNCSPFSGRYMSVIDNAASRSELGARYTPAAVWLSQLARYFAAEPDPPGYESRSAELALVRGVHGST